MTNVVQSLSGLPYVQSAYGADPPIQYSADYMRRFIGIVFPNSGVVDTTHLQMQAHAPADWSFNLSAGAGIIPGITSAEKYMYYNNTTINVPLTGIATSPASTRTHRVYLAVFDKNYNGASTSEAKIVVIEDTGGVMNPPANAVGYLLLGTISISPSQPSIQTSHISNTVAIAGPQATWNNLTLNSAGGVVDGSGGSHLAQWRKTGNTVRLRGSCAKSGAAIFPDGATTLVTSAAMPATIKPSGSRTEYHPVGVQYSAVGDVNTARVVISENGIGVQIPTAVNADTVWLDGIIYDI